MRTFVYHVGGEDFADTVAFGDAWKQAKAKAAEKHTFITRDVIEVRHEVFLSAGAFIGTDYADADSIKVF